MVGPCSRRSLLTQVTCGGLVAGAGCSVLGEDAGPFNFGISNNREQGYAVSFTVWDDDGNEILDGEGDIGPREPDAEEPAVLAFDDLVQVTNGDTIEARVEVDGETFEDSYEVTCNQSENAENNFIFRIRRPGSATGETMEFVGSEC